MKKILALVVSLVMLLTIAGCNKDNGGGTPDNTAPPAGENGEQNENEGGTAGGSTASGDYTIAVVPKLTALAWFERMEVGVKEYAAETGLDVFYTGSSEADGALQAQVIEDLIAQNVDAICVVPFSTEALEPVLKKARDAGIVVITHEASTMENIDYDIEAFSNDEYGEHLMEIIGKATGGSGEYIQTVGALTSASHMEWVNAAKDYQEANFPDMSLYGDRIETSDDQSVGYAKVKEALTANPNIVAIQGSAMPDVAGAALAVEELGLEGKVIIAGTALVSNAGQYVESGTIDTISFWDPALAGKAMIELAIMVLEGQEVGNGTNLGIAGYDNLTLDGKVLVGSAWIDVNKDNVDDPRYDF